MDSHFSEQELQSAVKVMEAINSNRELKKFAASDIHMRRLLAASHLARSPRQKYHDSVIELRKSKRAQQRLDDRRVLHQAGIRARRQASRPYGSEKGHAMPQLEDNGYEVKGVSSEPISQLQQISQLQESQKMLHGTIECHICRQRSKTCHPFYDRLCFVCGSLNYSKRESVVDMTSRVCLVTGARVKIGFEIALKLLRSNASKVIVTTRFPHDAARRFMAQPDSNSFKGRLKIYGADFRDLNMLRSLCAHIRETETRLDVLINNAAQTVRKPPAFYEHLVPGEGFGMLGPAVTDIIDVFIAAKLQDVQGHTFINSSHPPSQVSKLLAGNIPNDEPNLTASSPSSLPVSLHGSPVMSIGAASASTAMSQMSVLPGDVLPASLRRELFPPNQYDQHGQQLDLRPTNSWVQDITQVHSMEMIECHAINTFAPWILITELKPLMDATAAPSATEATAQPNQENSNTWDRYIVNVSAMEGQFYRQKSTLHPHTNMAKAALNMMTRTSAKGFSDSGIFMTCVDTGWVTNENPRSRESDEFQRMQPPLDEVDGAMRVLDPVFLGVKNEKRYWGVFLKNYSLTHW
ncbi:oxidoreductase [Chytriomyces cf. hyalinus JEL632]|nr:oxidoreductase [Chytriomyces cf. hyalinus JEL632]